MKACKGLGASPAVALFLLMAKAVYDAHPEQEGPLTAMLTADIRKALGMTTLCPASTATYLSVRREDLADTVLRDTIRKCRQVLDSQRTVDYAKTAVDEIRKARFQSGIPFSFICTYTGHVELGDCAKHVTGFTGYNCTAQTIELFEFNGYFHFQALLGRGTASFSEAICRELKALGVEARISKDAAKLPEESRG